MLAPAGGRVPAIATATPALAALPAEQAAVLTSGLVAMSAPQSGGGGHCPENAPRGKPQYMPSAEARTSLPRISKIAPDYATKGVHIHVKGVELKVLPGEGGKVVFKPVFSKDAKVAEAAIKEAEAALADPAFRRQLHDTATRATEYLRTSGVEGAAAKSAETNFLRIALEKMGLE